VDMFKLLKQAKEMQSQMKKMQDELKDKTVEAEYQGVKVVMNGKLEVISLKIDPSVLSGNQAEKIEKIVLRAINDAIGKTQALMAGEMKKISGGMNIPGLT
jgi:nucleoid-associated protein EbfC